MTLSLYFLPITTWFIVVTGTQQSESLSPSAPSYLTSASTTVSSCLCPVFAHWCPRFISPPPRGDGWLVHTSQCLKPASSRQPHLSNNITSHSFPWLTPAYHHNNDHFPHPLPQWSALLLMPDNCPSSFPLILNSRSYFCSITTSKLPLIYSKNHFNSTNSLMKLFNTFPLLLIFNLPPLHYYFFSITILKISSAKTFTIILLVVLKKQRVIKTV